MLRICSLKTSLSPCAMITSLGSSSSSSSRDVSNAGREISSVSLVHKDNTSQWCKTTLSPCAMITSLGSSSSSSSRDVSIAGREISSVSLVHKDNTSQWCKTSLSPCAIETYWNIHWLPFIVFLDQLVSFLHYSQEEHCLTNKFINDFANSLNF